jgi:hypothetical protein
MILSVIILYSDNRLDKCFMATGPGLRFWHQFHKIMLVDSTFKTNMQVLFFPSFTFLLHFFSHSSRILLCDELLLLVSLFLSLNLSLMLFVTVGRHGNSVHLCMGAHHNRDNRSLVLAVSVLHHGDWSSYS